MLFFISSAHAQAPPTTYGGDFSGLILLATIGILIYYIFIRPKREKLITNNPIIPTRKPKPQSTSSHTNKNWLWVAGLIVLVIVAASNDGGNSSSSNTEDLNSVALIACENRLKRGLHDPDSFKRSGNGVLLRDGFQVEETGNKKYTITVAKRFSATNGFGARVQNSYGCEVKIDVIADSWTLTQFVIN